MKSSLQKSSDGKILVVFNNKDRWKDYSYYFKEEDIDADVVDLAETAIKKSGSQIMTLFW